MANVLFKFCSGDAAVDILDHGSIFITSPLDLNDPFEMRPAWTNAHQARFQQDQERQREMLRGMPMLSAMTGGQLVPCGVIPDIPPQPQLPVESQRGIADTHNELIFSRLHQKFRILSLVSELFQLGDQGGESDEHATLMWSHYADQFQGICLALDPSHFNNGLQHGGYKVEYEPERASLPEAYYDCFLAVDRERIGLPGYAKDPGSPLILRPIEQTAQDRRRFVGFLTRKSPAWAYEREVRMIYDMEQLVADGDHRRITFQCDKCKQRGETVEACQLPRFRDAIKLRPEAVRAVVFGADSTMVTVQNLFSILCRPEYSHVETYWSALHSARYSVQYVKGDRKYIEFIYEEITRKIAFAKRHTWSDSGNTRMAPSRKGVTYDMSKFTNASTCENQSGWNGMSGEH